MVKSYGWWWVVGGWPQALYCHLLGLGVLSNSLFPIFHFPFPISHFPSQVLNPRPILVIIVSAPVQKMGIWGFFRLGQDMGIVAMGDLDLGLTIGKVRN